MKPPAPGTTAANLLFVLIGQIAVYEDKHFPVENYPGMGNVH